MNSGCENSVLSSKYDKHLLQILQITIKRGNCTFSCFVALSEGKMEVEVIQMRDQFQNEALRFFAYVDADRFQRSVCVLIP